MIFDYLSDIHLEYFNEATLRRKGLSFKSYWTKYFDQRSSDVLLIAGDLANDVASANMEVDAFLRLAQRRWKRIIAVLGNHDYWSTTTHFNEVHQKLRAQYPWVEWLENESTDVEGVRVWGATFWTHICEEDYRAMIELMPDYRWTLDSPTDPFSPWRTTLKHHESLMALEADMEKHPDVPYVVLTHHTPSRSCSTWPISVITQGFCNQDDAFLKAHPQIAAWVHGHIHDVADLTIGHTHVVCNPHGYLREHTKYRPPFELKALTV